MLGFRVNRLPVFDVQAHCRVVRRSGTWILVASTLWACGGSDVNGIEGSKELRQGVIYGQDDRVELFDYPDPALVNVLTERVGALLPRSALEQNGDTWLLSGPKLREKLPLCEGERFTEQLQLASCTAVLVQADVLITAGHCMAPEVASEYVFVRGYYLNATFPQVPANDVLELAQVLAKVDGALTALSTPDLAIVRLQAPQPQPAFELIPRGGEEPMPGEPVIVVGASEGLPMKIDDGATVFTTTSSGYFEITSDTFRGNSGSPVLTRDGQLLGMLVGGAPDYEWLDDAQCYRRFVFESPMAHGELVVGVDILRNELRSAVARSPARSSASCSAAATGRGRTSVWFIAASMLIAARRLGKPHDVDNH